MESKLKVKKLGPILETTDLDFESKAVLNPAIYQAGEEVHMLYRAIDENNKSTLGYARLMGAKKVVERWKKPFMADTYDYESCGVEDPRITKIDDTFYMTYVAHDCKNAIAAYAKGKDIFSLEKMGVITPMFTYDDAAQIFEVSKLKDKYFMFEAFYKEGAGRDVLLWEKDAFFFPRKINGKYALVHRILPDIQIAYFKDFRDLETQKFWEDYLRQLDKYVILENKYWYETRSIGGGAPPIETKDGWLMIYHSVEDANEGRTYHASAALLDLDDPTQVVGRLPEPLFSPEKEYEVKGFVDNVVFPTGTAIFEDELHIYYGAADSRICLATVDLKELLHELKKHPSKK